MSTRPGEGRTRREDELPRRADGGPRPGGGRPHAFMLLTAAIFALNGALNLFSGEWVGGAFFLAGGFLFFKHREIDRWPKAARALVVVVLLALAVAMFVRLIQRAKGLG